LLLLRDVAVHELAVDRERLKEPASSARRVR